MVQMVQKMDESEAFHKKGYKPASDYDRCLKRIENILRRRKRSDKHPPNSFDEILKFAYHKFSVTRYWISGNSTDNGTEKYSDVKAVIPKSQKKGDSTISQQKEMPNAWLDMLDKSNMFPRHDAHHLHKCYGLKDFIVVAINRNNDIPSYMIDLLLNIFSFVALKCKCKLPLFVKHAGNVCSLTMKNPGILECPGFRTSFKSWEGRHFESRLDLNINLKNIIECFQDYTEYQFQGPAKVYMTLTYNINIEDVSYYPCKELLHGLSIKDDFDREFDRVGYYNRCYNIEFYLKASWSDQLDSEVITCEANFFWSYDLLDAPKWSVQADIVDTSEVPLGDSLKSFLSLFSSTQTESLLSNPEFLSMLMYRRIYKQREEVNAILTKQGLMEPKVRKVTSKLLLKPEESLIPVESLDAILDFLFHDEKLQSSQHSNGSNPSTVEDEVEDKFFLSYNELSKYFKSTQPSSLLSRLAICLCIVNKYHGGLRAVNQLWGEFVLELKYCLENSCEIQGLEPVEPELDCRELLQKLQILNRYIKKKTRDTSLLITDTFDTTKISIFNFREKFADISELPLEKSINLSEARDRLGSSTSGPCLRVQILLDHLLAKNVFHAANPGCTIGDFMRWCLAEDWMEEVVSDEGKDNITNKKYQGHRNQWIKISDDVSLVFHKSKRQRRISENDEAAKVLNWLALVKPSDLVLKVMPTLIHSAVTTLLKHPECRLGFLQEHLVQLRIKLIDQFHNKGPLCTSHRIKMLEDHVHHLALIEQKMARAQYLLKAFRYADPSCMVCDTDLEKYVSDLVEFKEVPVKTSRGELPSKTGFGKLIYKFFCDNQEDIEENLKPLCKEYKLLLDCSKTTGSCVRLRGIGREHRYKIDAAFTDELQPPME